LYRVPSAFCVVKLSMVHRIHEGQLCQVISVPGPQPVSPFLVPNLTNIFDLFPCHQEFISSATLENNQLVSSCQLGFLMLLGSIHQKQTTKEELCYFSDGTKKTSNAVCNTVCDGVWSCLNTDLKPGQYLHE